MVEGNDKLFCVSNKGFSCLPYPRFGGVLEESLYDRVDDVIREMTYKYALAVAVAYKLIMQTEGWLKALDGMR